MLLGDRQMLTNGEDQELRYWCSDDAGLVWSRSGSAGQLRYIRQPMLIVGSDVFVQDVDDFKVIARSLGKRYPGLLMLFAFGCSLWICLGAEVQVSKDGSVLFGFCSCEVMVC